MRDVRQGQFYRHFKGGLYQVVALAEHTETGEKLVVYQALYGDYRTYARPCEMFVSEVDREKYPDATQRYRFEPVEFPDGTEKCEAPARTAKEAKTFEPERTPDQVNPILVEFLDAETLQEKMHILAYNRNKMDHNLLNSIAISLDVVVETEDLQQMYDEIMNCLSMKKKFESLRR